jgi:pilus assembly protein TadC
MDFIHFVYRKYPNLRKNLLMAHMKVSPLDFIKKALFNALLFALVLSVMATFFISSALVTNDVLIPLPVVWILGLVVLFPLSYTFIFSLFLNAPLASISRRRKDIEKEVLFAGRFLLIKLNSGQPLLNALTDASRSYGVASKYFKEIVDDITLGMPLEEALTRAMNLSPSPAFKKILFQINNALLIGVDVTETLSSVLDEVTSEQVTLIEAYGNKLNSVAMFYMLAAIVGPSLGLTIFVVVAGMIGFQINFTLYALLWIFVVFIQVFFIRVFKSIRPNINF